MVTSTHRMIQLSQLADSVWARAGQSRRAASNAAAAGFRMAAIQLSREAAKADSVFRAVTGRIARAQSNSR